MARKIQFLLPKRSGPNTAAWATLTLSYVVAWALWGMANANPGL